jgi:hypothetical protein
MPVGHARQVQPAGRRGVDHHRTGRGSATIGAREGGALSSVALPTATTIIVGTEVRATSSAEMSSGRRLGENGRCVRTSDTTHSSKAGAGRQWD